jgi:type II secretory pathway component PulC
MSILGIRAINLLLFTLSCFLVANIINQVGAFSLIPVESPNLRPRPLAANTARPWSERKHILDRNLFGAQVVEEQILPEPEPEEELAKTSLSIRLLGTVSSEDQIVASAAIENTQDRLHQVIRVGHTLDKFANVVVTRIDRGRIVLQNGAHREELLLDPQAPKVSTVAPSRRAPQSRNRRRGPASANASLDARLGKLADRAPSRDPASVLNGAPILPKKDKSGNMNQKAQSARQHAAPGEKAAATSGSERRSRPLFQGSVAECVQRNWQRCVDRYGEGNCDVWSNVDSVPIGAFGIDLPWCNP